MTRLVQLLTCATIAIGLAAALHDEPRQPVNSVAQQAIISAGRLDENEFHVHTVESSFQAGATKISVLLPNALRGRTKVSRVVCPSRRGRRWRALGSAIDEVKRFDLHNAHRLICVYPTFSQVPWYGDHPTDPRIRQESYFLKVVVPFVDREYPASSEPRGRLLVGFSKSG